MEIDIKVEKTYTIVLTEEEKKDLEAIFQFAKEHAINLPPNAYVREVGMMQIMDSLLNPGRF